MIEQIIGIFLFIIHYLSIEKKRLRRFITMSDISYFLVSLSYLLNNKLIGQYAILFTLASLIGKTFLLQKYTIKNIDDFVVHYFGFIISLYWLTQIKKWEVKNSVIMLAGLIMLLMHYIYYKYTNLFVYRSMPINKLRGVLKYMLMFVILVIINKFIEYFLKNRISTYRTFKVAFISNFQ